MGPMVVAYLFVGETLTPGHHNLPSPHFPGHLKQISMPHPSPALGVKGLLYSTPVTEEEPGVREL